MNGTMQKSPMNLINILAFAAKSHGSAKVISRVSPTECHQYSYKDAYRRTAQLAHGLTTLGVHQGDVVATLAWNHYRHFESWYAISGVGAVCHTVNPRLFADQILYILNKGGAKVIIADPAFAVLLQPLLPQLPDIRHIVWACDDKDVPELTTGVKQHSYESLLNNQSTVYPWPQISEDAASSMCFTSGTTGHPKGVVYSHRSNMLMAMSTKAADGLNIHADSTVLMVVPMFHANSWGIVYSAPMAGASLVLPGAFLDGANIHQLLINYKVTMSAAVPTVWAMLLDYLKNNQLDCGELQEVVIGGAAVPKAMIEVFSEAYGVQVVHAWGMTETSPVGTVNRPNAAVRALSKPEQLDHALKQGRPVFGIELSLKTESGEVLPFDGKSAGRLLVRGPWVIQSYFGQQQDAVDQDGWFDTGDIATIDELGYMQITDRAKDIIKSGGEWISSVELENHCMGHPAVAMAAVIAKPCEKWTERPLLLLKLRNADHCSEITRQSVLDYLAERVSRWWLPDEIRFVEQIPLTATGKIDKKLLRQTQLH